MSMIPSWKPTTVPVVTTAAPFNTWVLPAPTTASSPVKKPGKQTPLPSTLHLGSRTSFTGIIRVLSPGFAMCNSTPVTSGSSLIRASSSALFTSRHVPLTAVLFPNFMSLMGIIPNSSFTFDLLLFLVNRLITLVSIITGIKYIVNSKI